MRIRSQVLEFLHLDRSFSLLTIKNTRLILEYFNALDVHGLGKLNDIQFYQFMRHVTNLNKRQIFLVLDMLDQAATGYIEFKDFYLLTCIFIALKALDKAAPKGLGRHRVQVKPEVALKSCLLQIPGRDRVEKQFMFRHLKLVFEMMDEDGGGTISADEFGHYGFLFNLKDQSVREIFFEFDVSGDEELDYKEFKMFAMACIDKQKELEKKKKEQLLRHNKVSPEKANVKR